MKKLLHFIGNALTALNIGTIVEYFFFAVGFEGIAGRKGVEDACYFFGFIFYKYLVVTNVS